MQTFGEKLRILRKQRGMTLQELAQALGFQTHSYLSKIETEKHMPAVELVVKVSEFFNVPVDKLVKDYLELDS